MEIKFGDKMIEAEEVEVLTESERWNEYQLANGKALSVKVVLVRVLKAKNEKDTDGQDLYIASTQNIVKVK